jgi:hypothetical protein
VTVEARAVSPAVPDPEPDPETAPAPEAEPPPHSIAPRKPRTVGGVVFLLVLAATVTGVAVVALADWQTGLTVSGVALLAAAVARAVLPDTQAGMLGVRRKLVDVMTLLVMGGGLVALAALIPPGPPL